MKSNKQVKAILSIIKGRSVKFVGVNACTYGAGGYGNMKSWQIARFGTVSIKANQEEV